MSLSIRFLSLCFALGFLPAPGLLANTVSPASVTLDEGAAQQFAAGTPSTWKTSCGSITAAGLFKAPLYPGKCSITAVASDGSGSAVAAVTLVSPITMTPVSARTPQGQTQQFHASVPVTWTAKCGAISAAGLYTASGTVGRSCTIEGVATSGTKYTVYGYDVITASSSAFTVSPTAPTVEEGATRQFTASAAATWSATCGSISTGGLFTAPLRPAPCTITATSASSQTASTTANIVSPIAIQPASAATRINQTQQFTASAAVNWAASCGAISAAGLFTAPVTAGATCQITATASTSPAYTSYAPDTITAASSAFSISPSPAAVHAIGTLQFTATAAATWTTTCGSISASGLYTAPAATASCTVTATATASPNTTATAPVTIDIIDYTRYKGDLGGTGAQPDELLLTPINVNSQHFGQKWSFATDDGAYAQPLYINALPVNGVARNVLYVATANDSVYALDANTGAQIWKRSFLATGVTAVQGSSLGIGNKTGVLGTPVIDPASRTLYVVAETSEDNATSFPHRLHALDLATGAEKLGGPVLISDPALPSLYKFQRPGLLLANGTVYVSFGSVKDTDPYHGLVFAFNATTLASEGVFNVTPSGSEGGIWMSAAAPVADSNGDIYFASGNGTYNGTTNYGQSAIRLSPTLQLLDHFTPFDFGAFNESDVDLGAGSVVVIPDQPGPYPHELIVCGKPTPIYLLNRDSMGGYNANTDNVLQRLDGVLGATGSFRDSGQPCYSSPAVWKNNVYFVANHDVMKMFTLSPTTGLLSTTPASKGAYTYLWPGAQPVVSSNGDTDGIVWTIDLGTSTLRANDARNVATVLYTSPQAGTAIKWTVPTVANGFVYIGLQGKVAAYTVTAP